MWKNSGSVVEESGCCFEGIGRGTRRAELVPECDFDFYEFKEVRNQLFLGFKAQHNLLNTQSSPGKRRITAAVLIFRIRVFSFWNWGRSLCHNLNLKCLSNHWREKIKVQRCMILVFRLKHLKFTIRSQLVVPQSSNESDKFEEN